MEYNGDSTQAEGLQPCDRCERLDWLNDNMLCSFCVAWDEEVNEVEAQLDEARAHVEALTRGGMAFDSLGHICCGKCGVAMWATEGMHYPDCSYVAARKWLEAQVQDDPVPDIHTDTDWCECSVCKAEAQDYG